QHRARRSLRNTSPRAPIGVELQPCRSVQESSMRILGISGLDSTVKFKRREWPGLDEREYRMCQGHDAAAALVVDGEVVAAAAEERFNGEKHSPAFPVEAARYCLREARLSPFELDEIAHCFKYKPFA